MLILNDTSVLVSDHRVCECEQRTEYDKAIGFWIHLVERHALPFFFIHFFQTTPCEYTVSMATTQPDAAAAC